MYPVFSAICRLGAAGQFVLELPDIVDTMATGARIRH